MKGTTSSLLSATAILGLIAVSASITFASEIPAPDQSASPALVPSAAPSADLTPDSGANNNGTSQPDSQPSGMPQSPSTPDPEPSQDPRPSQPEPLTPATDRTPTVDQGGADVASGPVGTIGVTTCGQVPASSDPAPVSARGGTRNTNAPVGTPATSNPMLANTGSVASIAAGAGVIALAGGVTLVIVRKRHRGAFVR